MEEVRSKFPENHKHLKISSFFQKNYFQSLTGTNCSVAVISQNNGTQTANIMETLSKVMFLSGTDAKMNCVEIPNNSLSFVFWDSYSDICLRHIESFLMI